MSAKADPDAMLRAALDLAGKGFRVFPVRANAKVPTVKGGVHAATRDAEQIATWWSIDYPGANIGVACGHDDLIVIDVDNKNGHHGAKSFRKLTKGLDLSAVAVVDTPSGGRHYYLRDRKLTKTLGGNSAGKLGDGLDVRAAGGYVLAPPSSIDGRVYSWRAL